MIIESVEIMVAVAARMAVVAKVEVAGHMYVEKEEVVVAVRMVAAKEEEVVVE